MSSPTFIDRVLGGYVVDPEQEIETLVDKWHGSDEDLPPLHEWLGMTWTEYSLWAEKPSFLRAILAARATGAELQSLVKENGLSMAARGVSYEEVQQVREWLKSTGRI